MKASLFYLPSIGSRAEIEQGMAGMKPEFYQRMLKELSEQIILADNLGYDSVSFTEHHFHIEGFEMSQNPVLLDLARLGGGAKGVAAETRCGHRVRAAFQQQPGDRFRLPQHGPHEGLRPQPLIGLPNRFALIQQVGHLGCVSRDDGLKKQRPRVPGVAGQRR